MSAPSEISVEVIRELSLGDYGELTLYPGDVNGEGELLWRHSGDHVQYHAVGRFDPDRSDRLVYICEKDYNGPASMLTPDGTVLWTKHLGNGVAFTLRNAGRRKEDLLVIRSPRVGERPFVADHNGDKLAELPLPPYQLGERRGRFYYDDLGQSYNLKPCDIDNDGVDEVLAFNRSHLMQLKIVH